MYIAQLLVRGCALLCLLLSFISSIPLWAQVEHDVPLSDAVTSREEFLHKEAADIAKARGLIGRAYSSYISPVDVIVWEENWENEADHDQWWAENRNSSEVQAWFARWYEVVERGGVQEIWRLQA